MKQVLVLFFMLMVSLVFGQTDTLPVKLDSRDSEMVKPEVAKPEFAKPERQDQIFRVVEEMPRFPGCETNLDKQLRRACSEEALLKFISQNLQYPAMAKQEGISGRVIVRFVVNADGTVGA